MAIWQDALAFFGVNKGKQILNKFNKSQFWGALGETINDDADLSKYVEKGYNINADVFSIVKQKADKLTSIPYSIKEIKDLDSSKKFDRLMRATNYNPSASQRIKAATLETKALSYAEADMPFEVPNPNQGWLEFWDLSSVFMDLTGNTYWYKLMPEEGANKGEPIQLYCLPSHLMEIHLKTDAEVLSIENPIDYYTLSEGQVNIKFNKDEVVHITESNPNYGSGGQHLYGQSRLRSVWRNIELSNKGLDLQINMTKNAGVFGFIHGKGSGFVAEQGAAIKERLLEANQSTEDLSNIMGSSMDMGFTRISLTPEEIRAFESLKYNQKQICNALGWSDTLLNNDDGGKHDKQVVELKRVVTNTIIPQAKLFESAFNKEVLGLIKSYDGKCLVFDYQDLPEMQDDLLSLSKWVGEQIDRGVINRLTAQRMLRLPEGDDPNLKIYTVKDDIMSLEDAISPSDNLQM
tara:strand:- start:5564 stop:6952 length:1389 start_codon:yes stop_codon:yes gene_type:complete